MAVDFPTDIVLDVARAADPAAARRTTAKLNAAADAAGFDKLMADGAPAADRLGRTNQAEKALGPAKEFESLLVANMIEDMMGDGEEGYFGGGFAGGVWKSMMAEKIAGEVVKTTDFGVASKISKYFVRESEDTIAPISGINDAENTPVETRSLDAARKTTTEISRQFLEDVTAARNDRDPAA